MQIPRLYDIYKGQGIIETFEQLLENIFVPLFEVTVDANSHPQLHLFLESVRVATCSVSRLSSADLSFQQKHGCCAQELTPDAKPLLLGM